MSDIGEMWSAEREASQAKRASNRRHSAHLLVSAGVPFVSKNGGAHLLVGEPIFADFWPGTGLWIERSTGHKSRGVRNLIATYKRSLT